MGADRGSGSATTRARSHDPIQFIIVYATSIHTNLQRLLRHGAVHDREVAPRLLPHLLCMGGCTRGGGIMGYGCVVVHRGCARGGVMMGHGCVWWWVGPPPTYTHTPTPFSQHGPQPPPSHPADTYINPRPRSPQNTQHTNVHIYQPLHPPSHPAAPWRCPRPRPRAPRRPCGTWPRRRSPPPPCRSTPAHEGGRLIRTIPAWRRR